MKNHLRICLKHAIDSNFISAPQTAYWAGVKDRTWRSYEPAFDSSSRNPPRRSLWCFFHRSGIAVPPELKITSLNLSLGKRYQSPHIKDRWHMKVSDNC